LPKWVVLKCCGNELSESPVTQKTEPVRSRLSVG